MSEQRKIVASDQYKNAVEKRRKDKGHNQMSDLTKEAYKEQKIRDAKAEFISAKRQKKIDAKKAEIASYKKHLEREQKIIDEKLYSMVGYSAILLAGLFFLVTVIMHTNDIEGKTVAAMLITTIVLLAISLAAQVRAIEAEHFVDEYTLKINVAKNELHDLLLPPP